MKKWMKLMAVVMVMLMVAVGCTSLTDEATPETSEKEDPMTKDDDMKDDEMAKEDDMAKDDMKDDEMKDDMKDDEMMTNDGPMAPAFTFTNAAGETVSSEDLKGDKVYLKYWASWCSICLAGLGEVDELAASDKDFTFYTVVTPGANGEQSKEDFINWFNGLGYENIQVLFDDEGVAARELNVRAFPTSVFIGSDGVLVEALPGHKSNEQILEKVDSFY